MNQAFYIASSGVRFHQKSMDVAANNMANVNTTGYKAQRSSFGALLQTNILNDERTQALNDNLTQGSGVKIQKIDTKFEQGVLQMTDIQSDFAIVGKGFFAVESPNGDQFYTRDGNFSSSLKDGKNFVVDTSGNYVLDKQGKRIELATNASGNINFAKLASDIGIVSFSNENGLIPIGSNLYKKSDISGEATQTKDASLKQGVLENSSVDLSVQMAELIEIQRAFQFNTKIIQMADEIEQTINQLR